jgi:hypothetical protein
MDHICCKVSFIYAFLDYLKVISLAKFVKNMEGRSWYNLSGLLSRYLPGGTKKNHEESMKIADLRTEISTLCHSRVTFGNPAL